MTHKSEPSRRDVLGLLWGGAGVVALGESAFIGLRFLSPRRVTGEFGGRFNVGSPEDYPPGSVTAFEEGRFYLVRLADAGFLALYRRCTHLGCSVPYDPESGRFVCPCHGSAFTIDGQALNAPASTPLDLFPIDFEDGQIIVDTGAPILRDKTQPGDAAYIP